jgi:hypothetical protein
MKRLDRTDIIFYATLTLCLYWLLQLMRGSTFFFDEWDFILHRNLNLNDLFRPHNGHLSFFPVLTYVSIREIFGIESYVPYQVAGLIVHGSVCIAVYKIISKHARGIAIPCGLLAALLGSGWQNILWPFQIGTMGALSAGLWAVHELQRDEVRAWRIALLVGVSMACVGGGIAFAGAVGFTLVISKNWRVIRALIPVLLLYVLWHLNYGLSQTQSGNLAKTPQFILDSALASAAGMGGRTIVFGSCILGALLVLFSQWMIGRRNFLAVTAMVAFLLFTWFLTGLSRAHLGEPSASRYVYIGAIGLIVVGGLLLPAGTRIGHLIVISCATVFLLQPNLRMMRAGAGGLKDTSLHLTAQLAALELAADERTVDFTVDEIRAPQVSSNDYLSQSRKFGSPAMKWDQVINSSDSVIAGVNRTLMNATSSFEKLDRSECDGNAIERQLILEPGDQAEIQVSQVVQLGFNWINSTENSAFKIDVNSPGVYSIRNPEFRKPMRLVVSGNTQSTSLCS